MRMGPANKLRSKCTCCSILEMTHFVVAFASDLGILLIRINLPVNYLSAECCLIQGITTCSHFLLFRAHFLQMDGSSILLTWLSVRTRTSVTVVILSSITAHFDGSFLLVTGHNTSPCESATCCPYLHTFRMASKHDSK